MFYPQNFFILIFDFFFTFNTHTTIKRKKNGSTDAVLILYIPHSCISAAMPLSRRMKCVLTIFQCIDESRRKIVLLHIILTKYKIHIRCHGIVFSYVCTLTLRHVLALYQTWIGVVLALYYRE